MNRYLLSFFAFVFLAGCNEAEKKNTIDTAQLKMQMMDADRAFSKHSEQQGMRAAFMEYMDSNAVLLRPNAMPIVGGEAVFYLSQGHDTSYILTWEPTGGHVANSGELGYTYGVYSLKLKSTDSVTYGTYVSVWKKHQDGKWKFVLDTGNEGIGENDIHKED